MKVKKPPVEFPKILIGKQRTKHWKTDALRKSGERAYKKLIAQNKEPK